MLGALTAYILVSAFLGVSALLLTRNRPRSVVPLALATTAGSVLLLTTLDNPIWTRLLPTPNVWLWSDFGLPLATLFAVVIWRKFTIRWQRNLFAPLVILLSIGRMSYLYLAPAPSLGPERWDSTHSDCRQSTVVTCAPAAVASALNRVGVHTTEAEMTQAALTTADGTGNLGIYRALRVGLTSAGLDRQLEIQTKTDTTPNFPSLPAVISIQTKTKGLSPSERHAVAVLEKLADGRFLIADPFTGLQRWTPEELSNLLSGVCFIIAPKHTPPGE